jgi:hypothetical protein
VYSETQWPRTVTETWKRFWTTNLRYFSPTVQSHTRRHGLQTCHTSLTPYTGAGETDCYGNVKHSLLTLQRERKNFRLSSSDHMCHTRTLSGTR